MWWTIRSWTHTSFLLEVRQRLQHITFYIDILQFSINENYDRYKKKKLYGSSIQLHDLSGNRTRVYAVRGRRLDRLTNRPESRRQDSNLRPLRPERSALPNWATPRCSWAFVLRCLPATCIYYHDSEKNASVFLRKFQFFQKKFFRRIFRVRRNPRKALFYKEKQRLKNAHRLRDIPR